MYLNCLYTYVFVSVFSSISFLVDFVFCLLLVGPSLNTPAGDWEEQSRDREKEGRQRVQCIFHTCALWPRICRILSRTGCGCKKTPCGQDEMFPIGHKWLVGCSLRNSFIERPRKRLTGEQQLCREF